MIENKKYFVDLINSSKANKMTAQYHYSGVGFKKAILNLGIFRKTDQKLVGVLQWGCSFQDSIRLDRYVKEPIKKEEYLELNRFSMADSEGPNSESQAISLGIKWIKANRPEIKLLVSYAGRKEGNYGYIYQATNWEYLGYFISQGFWFVDGEERHLVTLWSRYSKYGNKELGFTDGICEMYEDVRKTWTKQFIYIMRLDKTLTPASPILEYPKPANEFPIKTREEIFKRNDEVFNAHQNKHGKPVEYYWEKEQRLFTRTTLVRRGELEALQPRRKVAVYNAGGYLEATYDHVKNINIEGIKENGVRKALISDMKPYKNKYFVYFPWDEEPMDELEDIPYLCVIDEIPFRSFAEAGRYLGCSRQAIHQAKNRGQKIIKGVEVYWVE